MTAIAECFNYGTIECLKALLPHNPHTDNKDDLFSFLPIMHVFREDNWKILNYVLFD